jgi:hypothetical protein
MLKVESYYTGADACCMWQELQSITDYKGRHSWDLPNNASLPDKLNAFYARLDKNNTKPCMRAPRQLRGLDDLARRS